MNYNIRVILSVEKTVAKYSIMHTAAQKEIAVCGWRNCLVNLFAVQYKQMKDPFLHMNYHL